MPPAIPAQQTAGQALEAPWPSRPWSSPSLAWLLLATTCTGAPVCIGLSGMGQKQKLPLHDVMLCPLRTSLCSLWCPPNVPYDT